METIDTAPLYSRCGRVDLAAAGRAGCLLARTGCEDTNGLCQCVCSLRVCRVAGCVCAGTRSGDSRGTGLKVRNAHFHQANCIVFVGTVLVLYRVEIRGGSNKDYRLRRGNMSREHPRPNTSRELQTPPNRAVRHAPRRTVSRAPFPRRVVAKTAQRPGTVHGSHVPPASPLARHAGVLAHRACVRPWPSAGQCCKALLCVAAQPHTRGMSGGNVRARGLAVRASPRLEGVSALGGRRNGAYGVSRVV